MVAPGLRILLHFAGFCRGTLLTFFVVNVAHGTHNLLVPGSNPGGPTNSKVLRGPKFQPSSILVVLTSVGILEARQFYFSKHLPCGAGLPLALNVAAFANRSQAHQIRSYGLIVIPLGSLR